MYTAFPCSDYYAGSAPSIRHLQSPWLARLRRRAANQGSHVPVLDLHLVGGILYPWRCRATIWEEIIVAESDIRTRQWRTSSPTNSDRINSQPHLAVAGALSNSRQRLPTYASLSHHKMFGSPAHRWWQRPVQFSLSAFPRIVGTRYAWTDPFHSGSFLSRTASRRPVKSQQAKRFDH